MFKKLVFILVPRFHDPTFWSGLGLKTLVLISKKSKNVRFISIQKSSGRVSNLCRSALEKY